MGYTTTLYVKGHDITITVVDGGISIINNEELQNLIDENERYLIDLARASKEIYKRHIKKSFGVENTSFALETLAHVVPDELGRKVRNFLDDASIPTSVRKVIIAGLDKFLERTSIVDIGEDDTERSFFDTLGDVFRMDDYVEN